MNKKAEIFAPGLVVVAVLLMGFTVGVIYDNKIHSQNEAVGQIALDAISSKLDYNFILFVNSEDLDKQIGSFFEQGASNKDSYKIVSDGNSYKLWAKKINNNIITKCYPTKQEILDNLAVHLDAEKVEITSSNELLINFGNFTHNKTVEGRVYDYEADFSKPIIIETYYVDEINKAAEFFDRLRNCGTASECYDDLNGIKEIDNSYFFVYALNKEINLKGVVTLDSGNPITEKFEC